MKRKVEWTNGGKDYTWAGLHDGIFIRICHQSGVRYLVQVHNSLRGNPQVWNFHGSALTLPEAKRLGLRLAKLIRKTRKWE